MAVAAGVSVPLKPFHDLVRTRDAWIGAGIAAVSVFLLFQTDQFRGNAGLMPKLVLSGILLSALMLVAASLWRPGNDTLDADASPWLQLLMVIATVVVYIVLIPNLGFYVSTFVFIAADMAIFGIRRPIPLIIVPLAATGTVYLLFEMLFSILMPSGAVF